jgi:TatD DNase family protein
MRDITCGTRLVLDASAISETQVISGTGHYLLVDSHCHLTYLDEPREKLAAARERGVSAFLCVGVDEDGIDAVLDLAQSEPDVWASVGQHPEAAGASRDWIAARARHRSVVALGEMGLDYFHVDDPAQRAVQREAFDAQLDLAARLDLPVIIHTRDAVADTLHSLRAHPGLRGVLHCFTESWEMASEALDLGYYVSISGIVTFNNGDNVRDVARRVPAERLLVETDCPWLAPVPHRGSKNEPAFVADTAAYLAALRGTDAEAFARQTTVNFYTLFDRARNR